MISKSSWTLTLQRRRTSRSLLQFVFTLAACLMAGAPAFASHSEAPAWMHALVGVPLPTHDEKDDAILLYRNESLTVVSADKFRTTVQEAYKILRPEGRRHGLVKIGFRSLNQKITSIHGWCIPASGKDYEVTDRDAVELAPKGFELASDHREKAFQIPAPDPGNVIGFEFVVESRPYILQDDWSFQSTVPVRESVYSVTLPAGWELKEAWANYPQVKPQTTSDGHWQWTVGDVKRIREEAAMPPWKGLAGFLVVTLSPPGGSVKSFPTWREVGTWENGLTTGKIDPSVEIRQEVNNLTALSPTPLAKMQALAGFLQRNIRYVAIELGIGGWEPHPAAEVFDHRYGDCKDKATLLRSMLRESGVESYYVDINVYRGSVAPTTPPSLSFNHVIIAIKLPEGVTDPSLVATLKHPSLGTLLFFDPTNEKIPFGQLPGYLQASYGLLVTPAGGELVQLPQQPTTLAGTRRTGKLNLTLSGDLVGDIEEVQVGDDASESRVAFVAATKESDRVKPVESVLGESLAAFRLTKANVRNLKQTENPFIWDYSFLSEKYAKFAGGLLLVRPRVLGRESSGLLETPEPRQYPIEFEAPRQDIDDFDITLPKGYVVDELPPAVDADYAFASYHSKTEIAGNVLRYHRTYEVKQLSVPVEQAAQLKKFYRIIASDERSTAVLKLATQ